MTRSFLIPFIILLFIPLSSAQNCVEPASELRLTKDTVLCDGNYKVSRIVVDAGNITLHCGGATLEGNLGDEGIIITQSNVKLKSCTLTTYQKAITLLNAPLPSFEKVVLKNNVIGVYALNTPFKPHGILFEDNERNMVHETEEAATRTVSNPSVPSLFAIINVSAARHAATAKKVALEKTLTFDGNRSTFVVSITAKEDIPNLLVYEHIPKELAATADEVLFSYPDVQVINADPDFLIPIGRIKINTKVNIEYSISKKVSPADPLPSTILDEGEPEEVREEPIGVSAPADISDIPAPVSRWTVFFLFLAAAVFAVLYFIEKKVHDQH